MSVQRRVTAHPVLGASAFERRRVSFRVDGRTLQGLEGESLAAALWANDVLRLRRDEKTGAPRGMYCGIGHCFECRVVLDGVEDVRSCLVQVRDGMNVSLGNGQSRAGRPDGDPDL